MNVESPNKDNSDSLMMNEPIEGTAFRLMGGEMQGGYFASIGKYRITDVMESPEKVKEKIARKDWDTIGILAVALAQIAIEESRQHKG